MLSSLSVGKVDAYPLVEPQDIANVTSNPFPFIGLFMGRITKRFFKDDGQNDESCLFIGSYGRRSERGK